MYDKGVNSVINSVIIIKLQYSKAPSTGFAAGTRYYFSKVPSTGTAVLLRSTVATTKRT